MEFYFFKVLLYAYEGFACMDISTIFVCLAYVLVFLDLELQIVMSYHVDTQNQTCVLLTSEPSLHL